MAQAGRKTRGGNVRSLERGLALLVAMNRCKLSSVAGLARETGLPRPTVYRLLETLEQAGYVTRGCPPDRYCLSHKVRGLCDGFAEDEWISRFARPLMRQFTSNLVWPVVLMTFDEGRMLVRETTHELSPLSIDHGMVGRRLPMLRTAAGRCYLAFAPVEERSAILDLLARSALQEDRGAGDKQRLDKLFESIRLKGYAMQEREINPKAAGISVPVRRGARVLACLSSIWISSALTADRVENEILPQLTSTADRIADALPGRAPDTFH